MKLEELQRKLGRSLEQMIKLVEENLHEKPYTKEEIADVLATTVSRLEEVSFTPNTRSIKTFKLRQRALHVFRGVWAKLAPLSFKFYFILYFRGTSSVQFQG